MVSSVYTCPTTLALLFLRSEKSTMISEIEVTFMNLISPKKMNLGETALNGSSMLAPTSKTPCALTFALSSTEEVRHHRK
jgi:hypothetical protein